MTWYMCSCLPSPYADADTELVRYLTLSGINVRFRTGKLTVVVGGVGAGKTSLISALTSADSIHDG
jgi:ABC-type cobalamin/Fe3+-siderophores transport system ATPase subunit